MGTAWHYLWKQRLKHSVDDSNRENIGENKGENELIEKILDEVCKCKTVKEMIEVTRTYLRSVPKDNRAKIASRLYFITRGRGNIHFAFETVYCSLGVIDE